jgi:hypothetical protein
MSAPTYATGKPLPPQSEWVPRLFVREGSFYVIDLPADDDLNRHAMLNPGTLRVEDVFGNVLWPEGSKQ